MKTYNICDFGALSCDRLQTNAIQSAIDTCFSEGGGRVIIPCGIFLTGSIRLRSHVELYLESGAILKGSPDPEDYMGFWEDTLEPVKDESIGLPETTSRSTIATSRWCNGLIRILDACNVSIVGEKGSYIDGQNCYDAIGEEKYRGPHAISAWRCQGLHLEGYSIKDSANWAHAIFQSSDITAKNITVYGGHDGFDVRTCDRVLIEDCFFYTGDDCIAGFDNHDVLIRNCVLDCACSALRFGGNNVLIENCQSFAPSRYGFRGRLTPEEKAAAAPTKEHCRHSMHTPFLYYCDFRAQIRKTPGDILIRNCQFENPDALIRLEFDGEHKWCCNRSLKSITFEDCSFTGLGKTAVLHGDAAEPVIFRMKNCTISPREEARDTELLTACNFERIEWENVQVEGYREPTFLLKTSGEIILKDCTPIVLKKEV